MKEYEAQSSRQCNPDPTKTTALTDYIKQAACWRSVGAWGLCKLVVLSRNAACACGGQRQDAASTSRLGLHSTHQSRVLEKENTSLFCRTLE
jgi:hypothetical protein